MNLHLAPLSFLLLAACSSTIEPTDPTPTAEQLALNAQSQAWSEPSPELIELADQNNCHNYQLTLDLARVGSIACISKLQSFSDIALNHSQVVAASHSIALRELHIIDPKSFDQALEQQTQQTQLMIEQILTDSPA